MSNTQNNSKFDFLFGSSRQKITFWNTIGRVFCSHHRQAIYPPPSRGLCLENIRKDYAHFIQTNGSKLDLELQFSRYLLRPKQSFITCINLSYCMFEIFISKTWQFNLKIQNFTSILTLSSLMSTNLFHFK